MAFIPRFSMDESENIGLALEEAGIPHERQSIGASVHRHGGNIAFVFCVPDERLMDAVHVIKNVYGFLDEPPQPVSGICPACNTPVNNVLECPDCGLALSFNPRDLMKNHPFALFLDELEKNGKAGCQ